MMEEDKPSRKRRFFEDDDSNKQSLQKKVRFPKGKKVKDAEEVAGIQGPDADGGPSNLPVPRRAAEERARRRVQMNNQIINEERDDNDIAAAEIAYQDNENFEDDGIQFEPFNLDKEREEGYFDEQGNFVEYVQEKEIKDAWLDSVEVDPNFFGTALKNGGNDDDDDGGGGKDLSPEELGAIKRQIADVLEPGETVTQALKRLKGTSNKKEKMSADTKRVFDQLTDNAMKLMDNGEYDVYNEIQETFVREAEGYEKLALAKEKEDEEFDMFGDDGENAPPKPCSDDIAGLHPNVNGQASSDALNAAPSEGADNDYVYDESSGYYYSSSLGYYYDPSTGLYCSATSGQWYSFNEETNTYEEVNQAAPITN